MRRVAAMITDYCGARAHGGVVLARGILPPSAR